MTPGAVRSLRVLAAFILGVLACGVPLWPIPYDRLSIGSQPSAFLWLILAGVAGLLSGWLLRAPKRAAVAAITIGFAAAIAIRVILDTAGNPESHNLWPFEVVIAAIIGFAGAVLGVMLSRGIEEWRGEGE